MCSNIRFQIWGIEAAGNEHVCFCRCCRYSQQHNSPHDGDDEYEYDDDDEDEDEDEIETDDNAEGEDDADRQVDGQDSPVIHTTCPF